MSTGKSTLVNGIVGERLAEEGNNTFSQTTKIVCYTKAIDIPSEILKKTIDIRVWDTPGLGALFDDEATAKEITEEMPRNGFACLLSGHSRSVISW